MKKNSSIFILGGILFLVAGCVSASRQSQVYPMSYDQTYQTTLDALDQLGEWRVLETDQLAGKIVIEKGGYFLPRRNAKVILKRVAPFKTQVELYDDKASASHGEFFDAIDRHVHEREASYPS